MRHLFVLAALIAPALIHAAPASADKLLVASHPTDNVIRYDESGVPIDHFVANGISPLNHPIDMTLGPDGALYVSSYLTRTILRYDASTGQFLNVFVTAQAGGLLNPFGLAFAPDNTLLVVSSSNNRVIRYDQSGVPMGDFVAPRSGGLNGPTFMAFGPDGHLYVNSHVSDQVLRYDGQTGEFIDVFVTAGSGGLDAPYGLLFTSIAGQGVLLVASIDSDSILKYDAETGAFQGPLVSAVDGPIGLTIGPDSALYVSSNSNSLVNRYNSQTGAFLSTFVSSNSGGLAQPFGLLFLPEPKECVANLNGVGEVDGQDLGILLLNWGPCE